MHLAASQVQQFKRLYGSLGLRCRLSDCRKVARLYKSQPERSKHEKTHRRVHMCADCNVKPGGFKTASALRKHREAYHMKPQDFQVPDSLVSVLRSYYIE